MRYRRYGCLKLEKTSGQWGGLRSLLPIYVLCVSVLSACMCAHHVCPWGLWISEVAMGPLGLDLQMVLRHKAAN